MSTGSRYLNIYFMSRDYMRESNAKRAAQTPPNPYSVPAAAVAPTAEPTIALVTANSEAAKASLAAAAAMANVGHAPSPQELAELVQKGQASKCAVVTLPPGAEVSIDGNKLGVTPLAFVLLKQGETPRTVTIKMRGYETVEKRLVPDGKTIPIALTLKKE
ncbi:MAG: PEGA domain-containing protein [Candidatus Solibacter sp.]|nr:PEGA domain-containing protein [Candidatus Solibacter sp.]